MSTATAPNMRGYKPESRGEEIPGYTEKLIYVGDKMPTDAKEGSILLKVAEGFVGKLLNKEEIETKNGMSTLTTWRLPEGDFAMWAPAELKRKLSTAEPGKFYEIIYGGLVPQDKGNDKHSFKVTPVEVKT